MEGRLQFAIEDPDAHHNVPKILANWRTNLLGSSAKGTEFFLRHMLGTGNEVNAQELEEGNRPVSVNWRDAHPGKLDLMWVADFRNTSTTLHSDVVLPAATWYEKHDLSSTDMHPFMHCFDEAVTRRGRRAPTSRCSRPWLASSAAWPPVTWTPRRTSSRSRWVTTPRSHDHGERRRSRADVDARQDHAEAGPDRARLHAGRLQVRPHGSAPGKGRPGSQGRCVQRPGAFDELGDLNGRAPMDGNAGEGAPLCDTAIKAANMAMRFSGTTNGSLAVQGFRTLEKRVGNEMAFLAEVTKKRRSPTRTPSCSRAASSPAPSGRVPSTAADATAPSSRTSSAASRGTRSRAARSSTSTTTG